MNVRMPLTHGGARRADSLFARAVLMPPQDQRMLLERECRTDSRLRGDLERLLELARELPEDGEPPEFDSWCAREIGA